MFSGPLIADVYVLKAVQVFSAFLGIWAVWVMKIGNFNITPTLVKNGEFRCVGPYHWIRHPMYTSLFLFVIPEIISDFSVTRIISLLVLIVALMIKMNYEEKQLLKQFEEYENYMTNTKRIIPFIY